MMRHKNLKKEKHRAPLGKYGVHTMIRHGTEIFMLFERFHLTEQHRSEDKEHSEYITHMSNGGQMSMKQLNMYKQLTQEDCESKEWRYAPMLVATNRESVNITEKKAQMFATDKNTAVFKWKQRAIWEKGKPMDEDLLTKVENKDACFWQYFVQGAEGFLLENINTSLGLANGTPIELHSLTFRTEEQLEEVQEKLKSNSAGMEIILDPIPLAVNVKVKMTTKQKKKMSKRKTQQLQFLKELSISDDEEEIIIPLTTRTNELPRLHSTSM